MRDEVGHQCPVRPSQLVYPPAVLGREPENARHKSVRKSPSFAVRKSPSFAVDLAEEVVEGPFGGINVYGGRFARRDTLRKVILQRSARKK